MKWDSSQSRGDRTYHLLVSRVRILVCRMYQADGQTVQHRGAQQQQQQQQQQHRGVLFFVILLGKIIIHHGKTMPPKDGILFLRDVGAV